MEPINQVIPNQHLIWHGRSSTGRVRLNNEDTFLGLQFDAQELRYLGREGEGSTDHGDYVFAVSDGMGGAAAGEFASRITVDKVTRFLPAAFKRSAQGLAAGFADIFTELYHEIHKAISYLSWGDPDCAGMGATLTLTWFTPGWLYFAHIGDSRLYYLPAGDGGIKQLSHDDTYVGWLFRQGKISEWEAKQHPGRTSLQKALGAGHQFVDPQVGAVAYQRGDIFVLCSDGVVDGLFDNEIRRLLKDPEPAERQHDPAMRIVTTAVERSGRDNTTAIVIEAA